MRALGGFFLRQIRKRPVDHAGTGYESTFDEFPQFQPLSLRLTVIARKQLSGG